MVPERFKDYLFNDRDYLPETYLMDDEEREELIRKLAAMITDDLGMSGHPDKIANDEPDFWLLDKLLTTDEIKFMLNFRKKRTAKLTLDQLAKRNNMTKTEAQYYVIKKGDTLSKIASRYHTTVNNLCRLNGIKKSTKLKIGRRIRVK